MLTLAEGVETEEQLLFLKEHDCELIQGFYFSRPVDPEGFTYLLSQKDWLESDKFAYLRK